MNALARLRGARVRRVDAPSDQLLALSLAAGELRTVLLLGLGPDAVGVGACDQRPAGAPRGAFARELRRVLEGARLLEIGLTSDGGAYLTFERGPARLGLLTGGRARPEATLWDARGAVLAALPAESSAAIAAARREQALNATPLAVDLDALRAAGEVLLRSQAEALHARRREQITRALAGAIARLARRLSAVQADLARGEEVAALRRNAGLLLSNLSAVPRGASTVNLQDASNDPPSDVVLKLDPRLSAAQQADRWFERARKLDRGSKVSAERAAETRAALDAIAELDRALASAADGAELERIAAAAAARGIEIGRAELAEPAKRPRTPAPRLPYREFTGSAGRAIRVGRGADDNDALTLEHARPHDLWLHARDEAGAHVVVPLEREEACPPDLLCDAATLAAHFSQARGQAVVDVTYVPRRYVRKPRKSPPGQVTLEREKVFRLKLEPGRLKRLLAAERGKLP